jgi:uncharacterized repeat protein (TIGR01451 family)
VCAALLPASFGAPAVAQPILPVTVTVTRFVALQDPDPGPGQGDGDFFARVRIDGFGAQDSSTISGTDIQPFWTFTRNVDAALGTIPITIQIIDDDDFPAAPDDLMDINPLDNVTTLTLTYNVAAGTWAGDVPANRTFAQGDGDTEHAGTFEGGEAGRVFFDISNVSATGDADGDGLLDGWETRGLDADGNGTIDVNLPAFGANPQHKDLFLELDTVAGQAPRRADILAMKAAFVAAPITAGQNAALLTGGRGGRGVNAPPNPDGQPGVTLHVDTGALVDPVAFEGAAAGTCTDGVDNGGDGTADAADPNCANVAVPLVQPLRYLDGEVEDPAAPDCADGLDNDGDGQADATDTDCLVGDNLGGGNVMAAPGACNLDGSFYRTKNAPGNNFNPMRRLTFRYGIRTALPAGCRASGGWAEIGGNDLIVFNRDPGSLMHELGHTLALRHGGNVDANCKPNYVSVMNYDDQFGIQRNGGGAIVDYSPPRRALNGATRGVAPLPQLRENALTEPTVLDATDANNQFTFANGAATPVKVRNPLNTAPNWNGDAADPPFEAVLPAINIDSSVVVAAGPPVVRAPNGCTNSATNSTLNGFNDWSSVSLTFRQFGDAADGAVNQETVPLPTLEEGIQLLTALNTTDVSVEIGDAPDPATVGAPLTYTVRVTNRGPNPASRTRVVLTLPAGVSFAGASPGCTSTPPTVTCELGELLARAVRTLTVTVNVPPGAPATITTSVRADNLAGPDPVPANNSATATTTVNTCDVTGTGGSDRLTGTAGPDVICGLGGDDIINGLGGDDQVFGGTGRDTVNSGDGADIVHGEAGDDTIDGSLGDDQIFGEDGNDTINGSEGTNTIDGGNGTDTCAGGGTKVSCEIVGP